MLLYLFYAVVVWLVWSRLLAPFFKVSNITKKAVMITGCDTGFGRLAAERFHDKLGMKVFAGCLTDKGVAELRAGRNESRMVAFKLDVTKRDDIDAAFRLLEQHGPVFALVNNAGLLASGPFDTVPAALDDKLLAVNVGGVINMSKRFWMHLVGQRGRLINMASVVGRCALAGNGMYSASKHAIEGFTDSVRREAYHYPGVRVIQIEPGIMMTPIYDGPIEASVKMFENFDDEHKRFFGREYCEKSHTEGMKMLNSIAGNPEHVVDALVEAVTCAFPRHRYPVGKDALLWCFLGALPSFITDAILQPKMKPASVLGGR